jgi:hypothetical protein
VGQFYSFTPLAFDPEGAALSFGIQGRPPWATFNSSTGRLSGTPTAAHVGWYSNIRIVVTDGQNSTQLAPFTVQVKPADTQKVTVRWKAPVRNTDGSPLTDLAGYRVYRGTRPGRYDQVVRVYGAGATQYRFSQLAVGTTQYVVVTSFDTSGNESAPSAEVSLRVQ